MQKIIILLFLLLSLFTNIFAADFDFSGSISNFQGFQVNYPNNYLSSWTEFSTELRQSLDKLSVMASFKVKDHALDSSLNEIGIDELNIEYVSDDWDLKIGKQFIVWGKADGVFITNVICPQDFRDFFSVDFADTQIPVNAVKWRYLGALASLEVIWIPTFIPSESPAVTSPWYQTNPLITALNATINNPVLPANKLGNSEAAAKVTFFFPGIDVSFSGISVWDDLPFYDITFNWTGASITPRYNRLTIIGAEFSKAMDSFVLRGEAAYYQGKKYYPAAASISPLLPTSYEKDSISYLLGVDFFPGDSWSITVQVADVYILDHEAALLEKEHTLTSTINLSKKILNDTLTLSAITYLGITKEDQMVRAKADYALTDEFHLIVGADAFMGNENGVFGQYNENNQVWFKAEFSF
ncbi:DUF1302 family protein [Candidatus Margulisiibacteriota bacterium]